MLLADLVPGSFVTNTESQQTFHSDYDWQDGKLKYQESQVREKSSWIKPNRDASSIPEIMMPRVNADVSNFSDNYAKACICYHKGTLRTTMSYKPIITYNYRR